VECTPDEIYDELRELRQTAERIAENIAEVASAIQFFTNNLFDEQHNPELTESVQALSVYLHRVAAAATEEAASEVERATTVVEEAVNGALQQQKRPEETPQEENEKSSHSAAGESSRGELPELPEMFAWRLKGLVEFLQAEANKLAVYDQSGHEEVWEWWEQHFERIRDAILQLEFLEEKAVGDGMTLLPYIEQYGGVPETILADQWPEEMVAAVEEWEASEEASNDAEYASEKREGSRRAVEVASKQRELFGEDETGEATTAVLVEQETNGQSGTVTAVQPEPADQDETTASTEPVKMPPASLTQAENSDSLSAEQQHQRVYTFDDWQAFHNRIEQGEITASQLQAEFEQLATHEAPIIGALLKTHNAQDLKDWSLRWGRHPQSTKQKNAKTIYQAMLGTFALGQTISYRPFDGETYSDAVAKAVRAVTDEEIAQVAADRQAEAAARELALTNPETVDQWRFYVRHHGGYQNLSPEQKIAFERVNADATRSMRADSKQKTISRLEIDEDLSFSIKEGYHDKKEKPLWIVQLSQRVERETYKHLKEKAQELGGFFSDFKREDAGFQFYDEAAAKLFMELMDGDVDNAEANEARKIRKMENASERFHAVADTLERNCQEILTADETKLKNTVRRADMAAGMREDAQGGLASVKTLRALANQLASGQIKYLDGVNAATQLATITSLLHAAKYERIRHELDAMKEDDRSGYQSHLRHEAMLEEPLCTEDIAFAEYPYPYLYRGHLEDAFAKLENRPGVKMVTRRMQKLLKKADPEKDSVAFRNSAAVELLADFLRRAKAAGYKCYWFDCCLEKYNRLRAANIHNVFELRTAMRELLPYVAHPEGDDPVVKAEQELSGKKLPGFFPTPKPVIYEMLELADIQGTDRVLEPSSGKGDILTAICQAHPDIDLKGIEYNRTLRDVLVAKGYDQIVEFGDFLEHEGTYEKILQNPPFEKSAEIDHVRHAYDLLSEGGRLVSVMSKGPFFRSDSKSREFRQWLDGLEHDVIELPEDAFRGVDAFRQTGVQTCLVTINKA